jgi:phosphinothricin acetyltransferase
VFYFKRRKNNLINIRRAKLEDIEEITEIYNEAILKTVATFDHQQKTIEEQKKWFKKHGDSNPIIVAEKDGILVGWGALSRWSDRCAYSATSEISLYVLEEHQGKGIGKKLMSQLIEEGKKCKIHTIIARITEGNNKSIHLHESAGFKHIGIMKEVGFKFEKLLDVFLMQKIYNNY